VADFFVIILVTIAILLIITVATFSNHQKNPFLITTYSASPLSCIYKNYSGAQIKIQFTSPNISKNLIPPYSIQEITDQGITIVTFQNVSQLNSQFNNHNLISNPLIESLNYELKDHHLVITIVRHGNYLPAQIITQESLITIILPPGNKNFPIISSKIPYPTLLFFPPHNK